MDDEPMTIEEILAEIEQAYPDDIFPDTTEGERKDVMERYPGFIDRTSAMMGRHLARVIRRKLAGNLTPDAADTPKARVIKSGMPKGYKFPKKRCPRCLAMVAENRYVQHIRSKCVLH